MTDVVGKANVRACNLEVLTLYPFDPGKPGDPDDPGSPCKRRQLYAYLTQTSGMSNPTTQFHLNQVK